MTPDQLNQLKASLQDQNLTRQALVDILRGLQSSRASLQTSPTWCDFLISYAPENLVPLLNEGHVKEYLLPLFSGKIALGAALRRIGPDVTFLENAIWTTASDPGLTDDAIQLLCSIPDRLARDGILRYPPEDFFARLAVFRGCQRKTLLLLKLVRLGHAQIVADMITNQEEKEEGTYGFRLPPQSPRFIKVLVETMVERSGITRTAEKLANIIDSRIEGGYVIEAASPWGEMAVQAMCVYWTQNERLNVLKQAMTNWSDSFLIQQSPHEHIEGLTQLVLTLQSFFERLSEDVGIQLYSGVTDYLGCTDQNRRVLGMVAAEAMAGKATDYKGQKLTFELDASNPFVKKIRQWAKFATAYEEGEHEHNATTQHDAQRLEANEMVNGKSNERDTASSDDDLDRTAELDYLEIVSVSSISSDSLESFVHSSEASTEISEYHPAGEIVPEPMSLSTSLKYISKEDAVYIDKGLKGLDLLIPSVDNGTLRFHAHEIMERVTYLKDDYELDGFNRRRLKVLVRVLLRFPLHASSIFWKHLWDDRKMTGLRERNDMLHVIVQTCAILSDMATLDDDHEVEDGSQGSYHVVQDRWLKLGQGQVTWASMVLGKEAPRTSRNKLTSVVPTFFYPIVRRIPAILAQDFKDMVGQTLLVENMIRSCAMILYASRLTHEYHDMTLEMLEALVHFRKVNTLIEQVLFAYLIIVDGESEAVAHWLPDIRGWVVQLINSGGVRGRKADEYFKALSRALQDISQEWIRTATAQFE